MGNRVLRTVAAALSLGLLTSGTAYAYDGWDDDDHRYQHDRRHDRDYRSGHRWHSREYGWNHRHFDDERRSWRGWHGGYRDPWHHRGHHRFHDWRRDRRYDRWHHDW